MKNLRLEMVFMVLLILMPIAFTSIISWSDSHDMYDLLELCSKEEGNDYRKSGEKMRANASEKYIFHCESDVLEVDIRKLGHVGLMQPFSSISIDILTPPPELV